jgi:acetyl esterase/lipase
LSSAINTHRLLTKAGVRADLHVWDGMGHGFFNNVDLPESREAFDVIARFFQVHLGHRRAAHLY